MLKPAPGWHIVHMHPHCWTSSDLAKATGQRNMDNQQYGGMIYMRMCLMTIFFYPVVLYHEIVHSWHWNNGFPLEDCHSRGCWMQESKSFSDRMAALWRVLRGKGTLCPTCRARLVKEVR